jgi:lipopolysaccharide transport system ATP-binding protein
VSLRALEVSGLGKRYRITEASGERYPTLREAIARTFRLRRPDGGSAPGTGPRGRARGEIWALRDIGFELDHGKVLGIIGRNGAGKSTLLKILTRVTAPTEGRVRLSGRVGALLEVGTGFHPELTGRENVYLNGSILGMQRSYIRRVFDEIVAFAEVEEFVDTPVKHFSTGMQLRLAFSVAAFLDADILLMDEVLAVGDAAFQKRCLTKMSDVAHEGRTVVVVSHHMATIQRLSSECLWIDRGTVVDRGEPEAVVARYLASTASGSGERSWSDLVHAPGNERIRLRRVRLIAGGGHVTASMDIRHSFEVELEYQVLRRLPNLRVGLTLYAADGSAVLTSHDTSLGSIERERDPGVYTSRCTIPGNLLNEGQYRVTALADVPWVEDLFVEHDAVTFSVEQTGGPAGEYPERWPGVVCPPLEWAAVSPTAAPPRTP